MQICSKNIIQYQFKCAFVSKIIFIFTLQDRVLSYGSLGNYSLAGFEMILHRYVSHYIITYYLPSGMVAKGFIQYYIYYNISWPFYFVDCSKWYIHLISIKQLVFQYVNICTQNKIVNEHRYRYPKFIWSVEPSFTL